MFCASQASTAIANDEKSTMARAIDGRRSFTAPCSSGDDYIAPYRQLSRLSSSSFSSGGRHGKIVQVEKGRRSESLSENTSLARKSFGCVARTVSDVIKTPKEDMVIAEEGEPSEPKRGFGAVEEVENKKSSGSNQVVVVLSVSLHCHCRGCQGKVKKHLSRIQGVTSFDIDFASKKVTVTGDITPLQVLSCLSKIKNAQFWTPPPPLSRPRAKPEN